MARQGPLGHPELSRAGKYLPFGGGRGHMRCSAACFQHKAMPSPEALGLAASQANSLLPLGDGSHGSTWHGLCAGPALGLLLPVPCSPLAWSVLVVSGLQGLSPFPWVEHGG